MTLKHYNALSNNSSSIQMDTLEEKEEKHRILVMALEKKCAEIKRSNEALAARYSNLIFYNFYKSFYNDLIKIHMNFDE